MKALDAEIFMLVQKMVENNIGRDEVSAWVNRELGKLSSREIHMLVGELICYVIEIQKHVDFPNDPDWLTKLRMLPNWRTTPANRA